MERERRNNLRRVIHKCRELLEDEITKRLAFYGVMADGSLLDLAKLPHLTPEDWRTRQRIEQSIEKEMLGKLTRGEAVKRYIHHVGFTYLNRFAALRAMEVRGLLKKETIVRRVEYGGRSLLERDIVESNPQLTPEQVLKESLIQAFQEVGEEIKVLFDMKNEYSLVFPETRACLELIRLLTEEVTEEDWRQDDVFGWIYQYFNTEARQLFRKVRRKPLADDIPVITQFYTPDWIVKVLTDNTLGRFWLKMHPNSKIGKFCTYIVPLKEDSLNLPLKKIREIKVMDPACGSGHFLVYAFDLLYKMYLEDEPETSPSEIPALILENNLFGIDIDLRSVQLAALSLYLKAKKYNPSFKVRSIHLICADIRIADSEKRLEFLNRFKDDPPLQHIFAKLFEELQYTYEIGSLLKVRIPFESLFKERVSSKKRQSKLALTLTGQSKFGSKGLVGQSKIEINKTKESNEGLLTLIVPKERTIEEMLEELRSFERESIEAQDMGRLLFATEAEKSIGLLSLLSQKYDIILMNPPHGAMPSVTKEYARRNYPRTHSDYYGAFIERAVDLTQTSGFIGALTGRALLMTKSFQKIREEIFQKDAIPDIVLDLGFKTMEEAHARYAGFILHPISKKSREEVYNHQINFISLANFEWEEKRLAFERSLKNYPSSEIVYIVSIGELSDVPGTPYAYWAPGILRKIFKKFPPLDRDVAKRKDAIKIVDVKQGLATADKIRFTRFWWEVKADLIALNREDTFKGIKWVPFVDEFYLFYFYQDIPILVNWNNDGDEIRNFRDSNGKLLSRPQNIPFFFRGGLTWSANLQRTQLGKLWEILRWPFRVLPQGVIFGIGAQGILIDDKVIWTLLGILCSRLIFGLSRMITSENKQGTAATALLPIAFDKEYFKNDSNPIKLITKEAYDLLKEWNVGDETSTLFIKPWLLQSHRGFNQIEKPTTRHPLSQNFEWSNWSSTKNILAIIGTSEMSLIDLAGLCKKRQFMINNRIQEIQKEIDEEVYQIYEITHNDRLRIERALSLQKGEGLEEEGEEEEEEENIEETNNVIESSKDIISTTEHIERLFSYYVKKAIETDEDGIVPIDEMFPDNLIAKVRQNISEDFEKEKVDKIEGEFYKLLRINLKDWIAQRYFDFHVSLYRNRPIFWQLASYNHGRGHNLPGVFSCFVHYHKLTHDTILKIRAFYLERVKETLTREKEHMLRVLEAARESSDRTQLNRLSKAYEDILSKIEELERFEAALLTVHNQREDKKVLSKDAKWVDKAIAEVRDNGWNPIIDYGVRVNIEPLKEARLLHPAVDRVK